MDVSEQKKSLKATGGGVGKRSKLVQSEQLLQLHSNIALTVDGLPSKTYEDDDDDELFTTSTPEPVSFEIAAAEFVFEDEMVLTSSIEKPSTTVLAAAETEQLPNESIVAKKKKSPICIVRPNGESTAKTVHTINSTAKVPSKNINPYNVRRPLHNVLKSKRQSDQDDGKGDDIKKARLELLVADAEYMNARIAALKAESAAKMQFMEREHDANIRLIDEQITTAIRTRKHQSQIHHARLSRLRAQLNSAMKAGTEPTSSCSGSSSSEPEDEIEVIEATQQQHDTDIRTRRNAAKEEDASNN